MKNDQYILEYLYLFFQNLTNKMVRRDFKRERILTKTFMVEWAIWIHIFSDEISRNRKIQELDSTYSGIRKVLPPLPTEIDVWDDGEFDFKGFPLNVFWLPVWLERWPCDSVDTIYESLNVEKMLNEGIAPLGIETNTLPIDPTFYCYHETTVSQQLIRVLYKDEKKVILPIFQTKIGSFLWMYFSPFGIKEPLFNQSLLDSRDKIVILTDSVELANRNQALLRERGSSQMVWLSWYDRPGALNKIDWSALKGRAVYYVLVQHSGFSVKETVENAKAVFRQLQSEEGSNLNLKINKKVSSTKKTSAICRSLKLVSYLHDFYTEGMPSRPSPLLYTYKEFMTPEKRVSELSYDEFFKRRHFKRRPLQLFYPLIMTNTLNLLYGDPLGEDARNYLGLSLAVAISQNQSFVNDWRTVRPARTIFISGTLDEIELSLRLKDLTEQDSVSNLTVISLPEGRASGSVYDEINSVIPNDLSSKDEKILIFDGLILSSFSKKNSSLIVHQIWLNQLIDDNWTVLIVGNGTPTEKNKYINGTGFSTVIQAKRLKHKRSNYALSLKLEKTHEALPKIKPDMNFILNPMRDRGVRSWEVERIKVPAIDERDAVHKLLSAGNKQEAVAAELGISLSMVKKRKRQIDGKEPIRDKASGVSFTVKKKGQYGEIIIPETAYRKLMEYYELYESSDD